MAVNLKPLIIEFKIFRKDGCFKAVTSDYVDLVVYGSSEEQLLSLIPDAVRGALEGKFKKAAKKAIVEESDTPHTYIAKIPNENCARA